ncbi:hypothetical protein HPB50_011245 [Hyalomma asiaticum]|uniref:Uncharacterized protein n=1 Tax=Hyalomma asiaticum TaxID=266040 RepID=A0ACB7SGT1_HYAAI|nr:hypothetical protein HPB50_011245 [Hyalomma asiaticum]
MATTEPRIRTQWTESETFTLISTWQDHIGDLRRTKRNSRVYATTVEALQAEGIEKPLKAVKAKVENLGNKYRDICTKKTTGQGGITWKFYWELHQFLGTLPANDSSLVDESGCHGETVDEVKAILLFCTLEFVD